jgi:hypothetical protein
MKKLILSLTLLAAFPICAQDSEPVEQDILTGGCVLKQENERIDLEQTRMHLRGALALIKLMKPDDENLKKTCIFALCTLVRIEKIEFGELMFLEEQLHWAKLLVDCIAEKIKNMSEYPTHVLQIKAVQTKCIAHARKILALISSTEKQDEIYRQARSMPAQAEE